MKYVIAVLAVFAFSASASIAHAECNYWRCSTDMFGNTSCFCYG